MQKRIERLHILVDNPASVWLDDGLTMRRGFAMRPMAQVARDNRLSFEAQPPKEAREWSPFRRSCSFRFIHIIAGVLWVGFTFLFVGFVGPSAAEVGTSALPLLTAAVKKRKVVRVIIGLGLANVIAGWVMWLRNVSLYDSLGEWVGSRFGLVITIGGVLATTAAAVGTFGVGLNVERLVDLSSEVTASGKSPTEEREHTIARVSSALQRHGKMDLTLQMLAVTAMATARYW